MQQVYTARDAMEAHFVKGLLEAEEIAAVVQGEALEETWGDLPLSGKALPSVWVPDEQVAKALPIIDEHRRRDIADAVTGEPPARPTWVCPQCGERVEEQFTQCWHCGHARPAGPAGAGGPTALA